jgi:hypothetical protein
MTAGSILTMIIVLFISWGGSIYFINMAAKSGNSSDE